MESARFIVPSTSASVLTDEEPPDASFPVPVPVVPFPVPPVPVPVPPVPVPPVPDWEDPFPPVPLAFLISSSVSGSFDVPSPSGSCSTSMLR
ncbi:hypothetical protein DQG23_37840 [Paenibacillus contaminans]|uniref:Uncharacterized protein n=1 Tax=Paenibacillus contaminans TaxID=450362 RepID=A0A329LRB3_9BACL|nr:hypothetical protein DQG23_37840 [Paenibacillus contaminans]